MLEYLTTTRIPVRGRKHLDRKRKAAIALEVKVLPSQALTLILTGSLDSTAHMVSALKIEFAQAQCYFM